MLPGGSMLTLITAALLAISFQINAKTIHLNSCHLEEYSQGQGPEFVMVNGIPVTSMIYQPLIEELQEKGVKAKFTRVDFPETGKSFLRGDKVSWTTLRQCMDEYLQTKKNFTLLLHDVSGPVTMPLIKDHAHRMRGLVILNTILKTNGFSPEFPLNIIQMDVGEALSYVIPGWFYRAEIRRIGIDRQFDVSWWFLRNLYREFKKDRGTLRTHQILQGFETSAQTDIAINAGLDAKIPKLFVWGEADSFLGDQHVHINKRAWNTTFHLLPDAKHFLMLDYYPELATFIRDWIEKWGR